DDERALLDDFGRINWQDRELVVLIYDSDITQEHVAWDAYPRLAEQLYRLGVVAVKIISLPHVAKGDKTGLDDYLLHRTPTICAYSDTLRPYGSRARTAPRRSSAGASTRLANGCEPRARRTRPMTWTRSSHSHRRKCGPRRSMPGPGTAWSRPEKASTSGP